METREIIEKTIERLERKVEKQHAKHEPNYQKIDDLNESISALRDTLNVVYLNNVEIRSGVSRIAHAEKLITQLPINHEGRNTWLLNYGIMEEAKNFRKNKNLEFDEQTQSCELAD